jgi:hypothetical protein
MNTIRRVLSVLFTAVLCVLFLMAAMGCVTHYQIKADYEREARMNVMRGKPALCTVGDDQKYPAEVGLIEMIRENWVAYLKELGIYAAVAGGGWYLYNEKDDGGAKGDTIYNYYYAKPESGDAGAGTGGAAE